MRLQHRSAHGLARGRGDLPGEWPVHILGQADARCRHIRSHSDLHGASWWAAELCASPAKALMRPAQRVDHLLGLPQPLRSAAQILTSKAMPHMGSSHKGPAAVASWNPVARPDCMLCSTCKGTPWPSQCAACEDVSPPLAAAKPSTLAARCSLRATSIVSTSACACTRSTVVSKRRPDVRGGNLHLFPASD